MYLNVIANLKYNIYYKYYNYREDIFIFKLFIVMFAMKRQNKSFE